MSRLFLGLWLGCILVGSGAQSSRAIGNDGADGRFERRESFHFTLFQDVDIDEHSGLRGSRAFEQQVLRELESAYDRLDSLLGLRPEKKLEVYVWDPTLFDAQFSGLFRFPAAGFYGGSIHIRGGQVVTGSLVRVLHHELVHAAFDAEAPRLRLPAWMNEGIAEWFEARATGKRTLNTRERAVLSEMAKRGQLFSLADLSTPSLGGFAPEAARLAYLQSYAMIDYLVQARGGEDALQQFWSGVLRSGSLDRGAKRAYRKNLAGLEEDFRRSLGAR
ncbi:MAG: hypothetical protein AB8G23_22655 [Myxococcota bacterium]